MLHGYFKYLTGVVAAEMPSILKKRMKAQAIAARTYLGAHTYENASGNHEEHDSAAVYGFDPLPGVGVGGEDFRRQWRKRAWNKVIAVR